MNIDVSIDTAIEVAFNDDLTGELETFLHYVEMGARFDCFTPGEKEDLAGLMKAVAFAALKVKDAIKENLDEH